ncbi:MAG TPA: GNAT family N-acetyltransferase, partial [Candidatus Kapabacteria bacterium]|nr:GNAT family N-acetyltransferase [Candidatus Kapabacteria bacterium]
QDPDFFLSEIGRSIDKKISAEILDAKRNLYCSDEFKCYLALVDTHVAGLATLYVSGNMGWFANAYTYEPYRKRGIQSALLYKRLKDSQDLGLISVFTDVEAGSASERNIERFSFKFAAACSAWEAIP